MIAFMMDLEYVGSNPTTATNLKTNKHENYISIFYKHGNNILIHHVSDNI